MIAIYNSRVRWLCQQLQSKIIQLYLPTYIVAVIQLFLQLFASFFNKLAKDLAKDKLLPAINSTSLNAKPKTINNTGDREWQP